MEAHFGARNRRGGSAEHHTGPSPRRVAGYTQPTLGASHPSLEVSMQPQHGSHSVAYEDAVLIVNA
ncbi:MAG: hypothetical protein ACREO3_01210, partial [Arenimonas sp.]